MESNSREMYNHCFLLNVDNALELSTFKMFFYKKQNQKRITILEVPSMNELSSVADSIRLEKNRNTFYRGECSVIVCVPIMLNYISNTAYSDVRKHIDDKVRDLIKSMNDSNIEFVTFVLNKGRHLSSIDFDSHNTELKAINVFVNTESRQEHLTELLCLVTYLSSKIHGSNTFNQSSMEINENYKQYKSKFKEDGIKTIVEQIVANKKQLDKGLEELKNTSLQLNLELEAVQRDELRRYKSDNEVNQQKSIDETIMELLRTYDSLSWDDEYIKIMETLSSFDGELYEYATELQKEFHSVGNKNGTIRKCGTYDSIEECKEEIKQESSKAIDNMYSIRLRNGESYSEKIDIVNKICGLKIQLVKLKDFRDNRTLINFIKIWSLCMGIVIIPFSVAQFYIFENIVRGNMLPLVCVLIFAIFFAISKFVMDFIVRIKIHKIQEQLRRAVKEYFRNLELRRRAYYDCINAMIKLENIERKKMALDIERNKRVRERDQTEYHKTQIIEHKKALMAFDFLCKSYVNSGRSKIEQIDIFTDKSVIENEIYWISGI